MPVLNLKLLEDIITDLSFYGVILQCDFSQHELFRLDRCLSIHITDSIVIVSQHSEANSGGQQAPATLALKFFLVRVTSNLKENELTIRALSFGDFNVIQAEMCSAVIIASALVEKLCIEPLCIKVVHVME